MYIFSFLHRRKKFSKTPKLRSILLFCILSSVVAGQRRCGPQIRKSLTALTSREQNSYIRAVELAVLRGYHIMFVEIHAEPLTEREEHRTCGFLPWHRRFLDMLYYTYHECHIGEVLTYREKRGN